jgi:hypothetical protein
MILMFLSKISKNHFKIGKLMKKVVHHIYIYENLQIVPRGKMSCIGLKNIQLVDL